MKRSFRKAVMGALLGFAAPAVHAADATCVDGLAAPDIHPGWSLARRTAACEGASTQCVLTVAKLRKEDFNEILVNEECVGDENNCVGDLASVFAQHNFWWWRGNLKSFCADDDTACVVNTRVLHSDWTNLDVHDFCLTQVGG